MADKHLIIIAGCNGAGKTTATLTLLPDTVPCREFINADEIARGLSPFHPDKASVESGRIMLDRIDNLTARGETFAFETTLSGRVYLPRIRKAREAGYKIVMLFFWLRDIRMANDRVAQRVLEGGHHIPPDVVARRYRRGIKQLFDTYLPECDSGFIIDNSAGDFTIIARQTSNAGLLIADTERFHQLKKNSHDR